MLSAYVPGAVALAVAGNDPCHNRSHERRREAPSEWRRSVVRGGVELVAKRRADALKPLSKGTAVESTVSRPVPSSKTRDKNPCLRKSLNSRGLSVVSRKSRVSRPLSDGVRRRDTDGKEAGLSLG